MKRIPIIFPILVTIASVGVIGLSFASYYLGLLSGPSADVSRLLGSAFLVTAPIAAFLSMALAWMFWKQNSLIGFIFGALLLPFYWVIFYSANGF